jgi:hypothetical protein
MAFYLRLILSALLTLSFALGASAPIHAHASGDAVASVASASDLEKQEALLVTEIDRQADLAFKEFQKTYPQAPIGFLKKTQREVVYRLKQMHVLTDVLKASGPAPATTLVAVEVLTTFVFAPLATAMGKPVIAGVMVTVPWGIVAGFGVFSYQMIKVRRALAKELGVNSLREFDRVRRAVVGYDIKNRVSSAIYQSLKGTSVEFEILRKAVDPETTKTPSITIAELEAMVKSQPEGSAYLQTVYMDRLDSMYYSALLLRFVNSSPELTSELVATLSAREKAGPADQSAVLRKHLIATDDVQNQIEREIKKIQIEKVATKKRLKKGELTKEQAKEFKAHLASELKRLQDVRAQVTRAEYVILIGANAAMSSGDASALDALVASKQADLRDLATEAKVAEFKPASGVRVRAQLAGNRCFDAFALP